MSAPPTRRTSQASFGDVSPLDTFYGTVGELNLIPGWIRSKTPVLWPRPKSNFSPAHWKYEAAKAALDAAGRLIDLPPAERRTLILRNPAQGITFGTTRTLVGAYQMILPGEVAASHRHSSHALRVIIDGEG